MVFNIANKCIYLLNLQKNTNDVIVCLYVDDILIFGTNLEGVLETKIYLTSMFRMKHLNEANIILGIKVKKYSGDFVLCQFLYVEKIFKGFEYMKIKEANTPYDSNIKLSKRWRLHNLNMLVLYK